MNLRNKTKSIKRVIKKSIIKKEWRKSYYIIREVIAEIGIKLSQQDLRDYIKQLRLERLPIIACQKGYKYASSVRELDAYKSIRQVEIDSELKCLDAMNV